jgi:3-oxoadipate enol-lactonase
MDVMADDMIGIADALGWDDFVLLGHSMGGMVAQRIVARYASRISALVLMDTSPVCPDGLDADVIALGKQVVREGGMDALVEAQAAMGGPLDTPAHQRLCDTVPGYAERGANLTRNSAPDMWTAIVTEIIEQPDQIDRLRDVAVPSLVIVGDQDVPFIAHSERMAKTIPNARLAVIADAGHSPQFEAATEWFAVLTGFLDEVKR